MQIGPNQEMHFWVETAKLRKQWDAHWHALKQTVCLSLTLETSTEKNDLMLASSVIPNGWDRFFFDDLLAIFHFGTMAQVEALRKMKSEWWLPPLIKSGWSFTGPGVHMKHIIYTTLHPCWRGLNEYDSIIQNHVQCIINVNDMYLVCTNSYSTNTYTLGSHFPQKTILNKKSRIPLCANFFNDVGPGLHTAQLLSHAFLDGFGRLEILDQLTKWKGTSRLCGHPIFFFNPEKITWAWRNPDDILRTTWLVCRDPYSCYLIAHYNPRVTA